MEWKMEEQEQTRTDIIRTRTNHLEDRSQIVDGIHNKMSEILTTIIRELVRPKLVNGPIRNSKNDRIMINTKTRYNDEPRNELVRIPFKHQIGVQVRCWGNSYRNDYDLKIDGYAAELVMDHPEFLKLVDYLAIKLNELQILYDEVERVHIAYPTERIDCDDRYADSVVCLLDNIERRLEEIKARKAILQQEIGDALLKSPYNAIYVSEMV